MDVRLRFPMLISCLFLDLMRFAATVQATFLSHCYLFARLDAHAHRTACVGLWILGTRLYAFLSSLLATMSDATPEYLFYEHLLALYLLSAQH